MDSSAKGKLDFMLIGIEAHPNLQLADWLESYAKSMELNIWTNSTVEKLVPNPKQDGWSVIVKRGDGSTRTLKTGHVVFAHGFVGGVPKMPSYPGMVRGLTLC